MSEIRGPDRTRSRSLSSAVSSYGSTEFAPSSKAHLIELGVPSEEIERLVDQYNRQTVPVVEDEKFFRKLRSIAASGQDFDTGIQGWLSSELGSLESDCVDAKIKMGNENLDFIPSADLKWHFVAGLRFHHTIQSHQRFLAYAAPFLLNKIKELMKKLQRDPLRRRRRAQKNSSSANATPGTLPALRRSARLENKKRTV